LLASDADRDQVAERLRHATAEGRLVAEELEERLAAAFTARTYGELEAVVADLPRRDLPVRGRPRTLSRVRSLPAPALFVAIPLAIAVVSAVLVVLTTVFVLWALVVAIGWLAFGHRYPWYARRARRSMHHAYGRWWA
jgi:Domain of unknown function (DUF1707)